MRQDMYKVIVERPRRLRGFPRNEVPAPTDLEDSPRQESLRRRHRSRKWLNENLAPLKRYLAAQVGRPWDKVYSEICAGIDRRNTVQQHIHQHIGDFVAIKVIGIDGVPHYVQGFGKPLPLSEGYRWGPEFYVDPCTGVLRNNQERLRIRRKQRDEHRANVRARREGLRDDRRVIDTETQLHRIDGIWYRVDLGPIAGHENAIDALRHLPVNQCPRWDDSKKGRGSYTLFDNSDVYARSKRQLSARELRHYRLVNDEA